MPVCGHRGQNDVVKQFILSILSEKEVFRQIWNTPMDKDGIKTLGNRQIIMSRTRIDPISFGISQRYTPIRRVFAPVKLAFQTQHQRSRNAAGRADIIPAGCITATGRRFQCSQAMPVMGLTRSRVLHRFRFIVRHRLPRSQFRSPVAAPAKQTARI